jgi:serine/threonine protein kinase
MPAPATADELLDLVQKSGVADEGKLKVHLQKLTGSTGIPKAPDKLAANLVREGLLTYFQAEQLLQGKWKRFTIGKYKVLEKLGSGGMGTVFLCEHKLMRRRVAVKVLPVPKADDKTSLDRFYREAKAAAAMDHPNIVRAYDIDQDEHLHFLVMEYVDGTNLQDLVRKVGPLDVTRACHYVYGAAVGLQYAKDIGVVHRDIKPGNILIDRAGVVKILDMGLARLIHDEEDNITRMNDENVLGTADYLAPEQAIDSHAADVRADIYSLGATFYFLLAGNQPFPEGTVAQKLMWHQHKEPKPVRELRPEVPEEVAAVARKMMAKKPDDRFQSPAEVMAALAPWVAAPIPPPAEHELPKLSPAIARGPVSMVAAAPRSGPAAGQQTADGSWNTPKPPGLATPPLPPADSGGGVWEDLTADTQVSAADATRSATRAKPKSRLNVPAVSEPKPRKKWMLPAAVGAGLLVICGGVAAYTHFSKSKPTTQPQAGGAGTGGGASQSGAKRLFVGKAGENAYPTLREAIAKAAPGDTIAVVVERLPEPALAVEPRKLKDLTIESDLPGGKPAVIEFGGPPGKTMFDVEDIDFLKLRNLEFDGKGAAEIGIRVSGRAEGAVFEGVTVRNMRTIGVRLTNVAGASGRPFVLDRVRVVGQPGGDALLSVFSHAHFGTRAVAVKNGRFEGPAKAGIKVEGPSSDLEVSGNRFFRCDVGVTFGPPGDRPVQARVTGNTFFGNTGVFFDLAAVGPKVTGKYDVAVNQNFFAQTWAMVRASGTPPVPGLNSQGNGHDPGSKQGNAEIKATVIENPKLPQPKPEDDATFLRFPDGPNRPKVGAQ